jgi:hypothetical protein
MSLDYRSLLEGTKLFRNLPKYDDDYKKYILDRRQIWENLDRITESDVKRTMIEFLKAWRIRNVNRINIHGLKEALQGLSGYFKVLRIERKNLLELNFDEEIAINGQKKKISNAIKDVYRRLVCKENEKIKGIGPTSASKIMHCVVPEVFMMWDNKIREGYGYAGNEVGYLKFMLDSQRILRMIMRTYPKSPEDLCREAYPNINKTLTKLLDEFNYMKFTQGKDLPNPVEDC